ncbi:MAG TPA: response regulator [Myxococcales bacterium]
MAHILVVDDSEEVREYLALVLESAGYRVSQAASAQQGFDLVGELRPDLLLTDVMMPGPSGLDLLSWIRSDLAPPVPPVIVSSGFPNTEQEALQRGAALFVPKPADPDALLGLVEQVFRERSFPQGKLLEPEARLRPVAEARVRAADARRKARDAAGEAVAGMFERFPDAAARAALGVSWLARYFGFGSALLALEQDHALRVSASSGEPSFAPGQPLDEALPQCMDILETGSPLLLPDVTALPSFATLSRTGRGLRFFAGVPVVAPGGLGLRVGVLCLVSGQPHEFDVFDLAILDFLARTTSELRFGDHRPQADQLLFRAPGILSRAGFLQLLGIELRAARAVGGAVELAALELERSQPDPSALESAWEARGTQRFAVGDLDCGRWALFKRAAGSESASLHVEGVVQGLAPLRAVGVMSVAADGPAVGAETALRYALEALEVAKRAGEGKVIRFATLRFPFAQPEA